MSALSDPDRLERLAQYVRDDPPSATPVEVSMALDSAAERIRSLQARLEPFVHPPTVTQDELAEAIRVASAMSDDDFFDAADKIGLDPFTGMNRGRFSGKRGGRTLSTYRIPRPEATP